MEIIKHSGSVIKIPYIKKEKRSTFDEAINKLIALLKSSTDSGMHDNGDVVYAIYRLLVDIYAHGNFEIKSNALKVLDSARLEFYRRIMSPYEDQKIIENSDVKEGGEPQ